MEQTGPSPAAATRVKTWLDIATSLILIASAIALLWLNWARPAPAPTVTGRPPLVVPADPVSVAGMAGRGSSAAKIAIIEFSDFECPYCGSFARETLADIERDYLGPGRVILFFRHLPLPNHAKAFGAAVAAECAGQQGAFWPMHDRLFAAQSSLDGPALAAAAATLALRPESFQACVAGPGRSRVSADLELAGKLGITGTPAFLIGERLEGNMVEVRRVISGAVPAGKFREELDSLLK